MEHCQYDSKYKCLILAMLQINLFILRLRLHVNLVIVFFKIALRPCILLPFFKCKNISNS